MEEDKKDKEDIVKRATKIKAALGLRATIIYLECPELVAKDVSDTMKEAIEVINLLLETKKEV